MYHTGLRARLCSRHYLQDASPREREEHSHDYLVEVTVAGPELDARGYLIDIDQLKVSLSAVLGRYENQCLNRLPEFASARPSLENLAREVHDRLGAQLGSKVSFTVRIWEDQEAWAGYAGPPA